MNIKTNNDMKRDFYQLVAVFATCACTLFCSSCAPKQELQKDIISPSYVFDKNKAVGFSRVEEFITSDVTLDLGDVMANFVLPQLKFSEKDIFVSSMTEVLRFGIWSWILTAIRSYSSFRD